MGRAGSSSSGRKVDEEKQIASVFEELISNIVPVDFNLPPGEWKSGYYVPIKRNVYLTKRRIEDYGVSCSCVPSGSSVSCGEDCQCGMLFSCCSSNCKCDSKCANKSFQRRPLKKTKLIWIEECGYGLVAEDGIKKGEFVMEYVGEVIDDRICEERLWKMKRQCATKFYLCEVSSDMIIDSTNKGNMSRFINHSCEPNTEMQKWTIDGETRIGIFAIRDIKKGDQLTYDSKFSRFGAHQVCHCGASKCKKILGKAKPIKSIDLDNGNLSLEEYVARWSTAYGGQPCGQLKAWALAHKGNATSNVDYNPEDPPSAYSNATVHSRLSEYTSMAREVHEPEYDPSTQDLDGEIAMRVGGGKKHGRFWIDDSMLDTATTPTLSQIRARSTSSALPICPWPSAAQIQIEQFQAQLQEEMEAKLEAERKRMEEMFQQWMGQMNQYMQSLGLLLPPPARLFPSPPPTVTPNQSTGSNDPTTS